MGPGFGSKANYGGFDRDTCQPRTHQSHFQNAARAAKARTATERQKIEKLTGARWSELFRLEYYDAIRMCALDPMHNLFLGTARHVMKTWIDCKILSDKDLAEIQRRVDSFQTPREIGRTPHKIVINFSGFTADQWRNWVCIFSAYSLKGLLPEPDYACWMHFVQACTLLCNTIITEGELNDADSHLLQFCRGFQDLYGAQYCTMNIHMHLHLRESVLELGPVYGFWLYAYERMNGLLTKIPTNSVNICPQLMKKYVQWMTQNATQCPVWDRVVQGNNDDSGVLKDAACSTPSSVRLQQMQMARCTDLKQFSYAEGPHVEYAVADHDNVCVLSEDERDCMGTMYSYLYGRDITVLEFVQTVPYAIRAGVKLEVCRSDGSGQGLVLAKWAARDNATGLLHIQPAASPRPGVIRQIFISTVIIKEAAKRKKITHVIARLDWLKRHPNQHHFGQDTTVWGTDYELATSASFMPVQRVMTRCVITRDQVQFKRGHREQVSVVVPLHS